MTFCHRSVPSLGAFRGLCRVRGGRLLVVLLCLGGMAGLVGKAGAAALAPVIEFLQPRSDEHLSVREPVVLQAQVSDPNNDVVLVEYFIGQDRVGATNAPPWRIELRDLSPGWTLFRARATDATGLQSWSLPASVALHNRRLLISRGAAWRYLETQSDPGTAWRGRAYNDSFWPVGRAQFGYGNGDEATQLGYVPGQGTRFLTTAFRHQFQVADPAAVTSLVVRVLRDDGAVVYLNGFEVTRHTMPSGFVNWNTPATAAIRHWDEWQRFYETSIPPAWLVRGTNVLAVELHQDTVSGVDASFDLELSYNDELAVTRGPYLQVATPTGMVVRWRTDRATESRVRYGTNLFSLVATAGTATATTEHEVTLAGLQPSTRYFYSVGNLAGGLVGGPASSFVTAPPVGTRQPVRFWALGDSGYYGLTGRRVRDAFYKFNQGAAPDFMLMLGDNVYETGLDHEYQHGVFENFGVGLRHAPLWLTLGNHDVALSESPSLSLPYFLNFTLPATGGAGGVPSGTEKYYSFDRGDIHFVVLDPQSSDRSSGGPMLTWLRRDLATNRLPWLIAVMHHPPYSKGAKDSDAVAMQYEMRQNAIPILEEWDADLVLSGDSHAYERSYFMAGHYGSSGTFSPAYIRQAGNGRTNGTGAYLKYPRFPRQGTVYIEAGNASRMVFGPLNHPAMFYSAQTPGSLVIDVNSNRLDCQYVRDTGTVDDSFTILKLPPTNRPPQAAADIGLGVQNTPLVVPAGLLLTNDVDPEGGPLSVISAGPATTRGGLVTVTNGMLVYSPATDVTGIDSFTYSAGDTNGAVGIAQVTVSLSGPLTQVVSTAVSNAFTGRLTQTLRVRNAGLLSMPGLRLHVRNLPAGVQVANALATLDGVPFVHLAGPLGPNQFVPVTLEYLVPPGVPFTAPTATSLKAVVVGVAPRLGPATEGVVPDSLARQPSGEVRIGIASRPAALHLVQYGTNGVDWINGMPVIPGTGAAMTWWDAGPPNTATHPTNQPGRVYRLVELSPGRSPALVQSGFGTGGVFQVTFASESSRLYAVQTAGDVTEWTNAVPVLAGTGGLITWRDSVPVRTGSRRFFRIREIPGTWR